MRRAVLRAAGLALLAGPTVLAFFSGGYFAEAREWAGLGAWLLVAIALLVRREPLPRAKLAWLAIGALLAFAGWTLLSMLWAPIVGNAYAAGQIAALYAGVLLAAALLLGARELLRSVEPALVAGAVIVIGYGLAGRLLPGVLHFARSIAAEGRLEQPLTYWNAMGELAAIGFVLCARLAGDSTRDRRLRAGAAAAAAPLGMGLYLSFSRGALFACVAGLITLVAIAPRREQLSAVGVVVVAGGLAAAAAAPFHGVNALLGSTGTRETQGAVVLVLLIVIMLAAALSAHLVSLRVRPGELRLPRRAPLIALALVCAGLALAIVVGAKEGTGAGLSSGASRYTSLQSNRYDYWSVALRAFGTEPLHGVGAGGWQVWWLRYRTINDFARDAHSLPLQTLAELGIVGLLLLLAFLTAIGVAARTAHRVAPELSAGLTAGFITWLVHQPLDWDWELPALTLVGMLLAGALLAAADQSSSAILGASRANTQTPAMQIPT